MTLIIIITLHDYDLDEIIVRTTMKVLLSHLFSFFYIKKDISMSLRRFLTFDECSIIFVTVGV